MQERRRDLERAHHAEPGNIRRFRRGDISAVVEDLPARGWQELRDQVEASRLPGPVGTDQGMNRTTPDLEIDPLNRRKTLEFLRKVPRFENIVLSHSARPSPLPTELRRIATPAAAGFQEEKAQHKRSCGKNHSARNDDCNPKHFAFAKLRWGAMISNVFLRFSRYASCSASLRIVYSCGADI